MKIIRVAVSLSAVCSLFIMLVPACAKCGEKAARQVTQKALETAVEKASGGKANIEVSENIDLSGLPDYLKYPQAKATARWSVTGEQGTGTAFSLETADARPSVVAWYKSSLEAAGWKQTAIFETADGTTLSYGAKGEGKGCSVTVSTGDSKTLITVMYTTK